MEGAIVRVAMWRDPLWRTTLVRTAAAGPDGRWRRLDLRRDGGGRWWSGKREHEALRGCEVVDLGLTPATNTLAIGLLGLSVGQAADLDVARVRFCPVFDRR